MASPGIRRGLALLLFALILALLVGRRCAGPDGQREPLLVPAELARVYDVQGILDYVAHRVRRVDYEGILRGAHGTLWTGAGNDWDRTLLAAAALEAEGLEVLVLPERGPRLAYRDGLWHTLDLASGAREQSESPPASGVPPQELAARHPELFHHIAPALIFEAYPGAPFSRRVEAPHREILADWVHQPVILEMVGDSETPAYVLEAGGREVLASDRESANRRAVLELTWSHGEERTTWRRVLYDRRATSPTVPGYGSPRQGDRYAVLLAPGPLGAKAIVASAEPTDSEVLRTRGILLEEHDETVRDLVVLGTAYLVASDDHTLALASAAQVELDWPSPRLVVAAGEYGTLVESGVSGPALSLDVLANDVSTRGAPAARFQTARGFANDQIETRVLFKATLGKPVVSASSILARAQLPPRATLAGRLEALELQALRLLEREPLGTRLEVGYQAAALAAPLAIERAENGLTLHGIRQGDPPDDGLFVPDQASAVTFGSNPRALALAAESILGRHLAEDLGYAVEFFRLERPLPREPLPIAPGSVLLYRAEGTGRPTLLAVRVSFDRGRPVGAWVDLESGRSGRAADPLDREALTFEQDQAVLRAFLAPAKASAQGAPTARELRAGESPVRVEARRLEVSDEATAIVLADARFPLLLEWRSPRSTLVLEGVSPVVFGRVVDEETGHAVAGATVHWAAGPQSVTAAADGSFALPLARPLARRLVLLLDDSGSMALGLDPASKETAPAGESRMDALRSAVATLLDGLPPGVEVSLRTFLTGVVADYTSEITDLRDVVASLEACDGRGCGTPLTRAVRSLLADVRDDPLSRDATVVLLADGGNSDREPAAEAYRRSLGGPVIHAVGFAIEPGGVAEQELRELAAAARGTYREARSESELKLAFQQLTGKGLFRGAAGSTRLEVTAADYWPASTRLAVAGERAPTEIALRSKLGPRGLLVLRRANLGELHQLRDLAKPAQEMIEERLRDEQWSVLIPRRRVVVGAVAAYGWFELEESTGRLVGRIEDGLHGASAADVARYVVDPVVEALADTHQTYVEWLKGITAYTAGSVLGGLRWHRQPGALSPAGEEFERFVQAHALQHAASVGGGAPYWTGVCLNFKLQSLALRLEGAERCSRAWCESWVRGLPDEARDEILDAVLDDETARIGELLRDLLADGGAPQACLPSSEEIDRQLQDALRALTGQGDISLPTLASLPSDVVDALTDRVAVELCGSLGPGCTEE